MCIDLIIWSFYNFFSSNSLSLFNFWWSFEFSVHEIKMSENTENLFWSFLKVAVYFFFFLGYWIGFPMLCWIDSKKKKKRYSYFFISKVKCWNYQLYCKLPQVVLNASVMCCFFLHALYIKYSSSSYLIITVWTGELNNRQTVYFIAKIF